MLYHLHMPSYILRTFTEYPKLETDRSKGVAQTTFTVNLQKGYNVIRIGSRFSWSPDLDCFTLTPVK